MTVNRCHSPQMTGLGVRKQPQFGLAFVDDVSELTQVLSLACEKHWQQTNSYALRDKLCVGMS